MSVNTEVIYLHPREFIDGFSNYFPISKSLLEKYEDVWNWKLLSKNTSLKWDAELIEHFINNWKWGYLGLSCNESIQWSPAMLNQFETWLSWYHLGWQKNVVNDPALMALCFQHWTEWHQSHLFAGYSFMPNLEKTAATWAEELFETWSDLNWAHFSDYSGFPWSENFIAKHAEKLDWGALSRNQGLPWSERLINKYIERWDWTALSYAISPDNELLQAFQGRIQWFSFSINNQNKLDSVTLTKYKNDLRWVWQQIDEGGYIVQLDGLYNSLSFAWTPELFNACNEVVSKQFQQLISEKSELLLQSSFVVLEQDEHWTTYLNGENWSIEFLRTLMALEQSSPGKKYINWQYFADSFSKWQELDNNTLNHCLNNVSLVQLSTNTHFPWHQFPDLLHKLKKEENADHRYSKFSNLSNNKRLQLSADLLEQFTEDWDWCALSANQTLNITLIEKFKEHWDWQYLITNTAIDIYLIKTYPACWNIWWRENDNPPFRNRNIFLQLLGIDEEKDLATQLTEAELDRIISALENKPANLFKEDFEKALAAKDFGDLVPAVTHDGYLPFLITHYHEITKHQWPVSFFESLGRKGCRLIMRKDFKNAIALFRLLLHLDLSGKVSDLSPYCNALYAIQSDNNGFAVDAELNYSFLEKCMPFAPTNPAIYFNAACLYAEMKNIDLALECIRLAKVHSYHQYESMLEEIRNAKIFTALVADERFRSL